MKDATVSSTAVDAFSLAESAACSYSQFAPLDYSTGPNSTRMPNFEDLTTTAKLLVGTDQTHFLHSSSNFLLTPSSVTQ